MVPPTHAHYLQALGSLSKGQRCECMVDSGRMRASYPIVFDNQLAVNP